MPYIGKSPTQGVRTRYLYTATASQTTFSGTDTQGLTLTYSDSNFIDVHQNGVLLKVVDDYTATSGTSVVLGTGATADDVVEIIVYDVFSVGNFYNRTDSDSRYALTTGATMSGALDLNGTELVLDVDGDTSITSDTDDQIDIKIAGADKLKIDGSSHLVTHTAGTSNLVLGVNAGNSIASGGNYNVALGDEAGTAITTGDNNTFVGYQAGDSVTTGGANNAFGYDALGANESGGENNAFGRNALGANTGNGNTAFGHRALQANTSGTNNVAVGHSAGTAVTTGQHNTIMGSAAGDALIEGNYNVAIGGNSLSTDTKGSRSVAVGYGALNPQNFTSATDAYNIGIGYAAGNALSTGTGNTLIGGEAGDNIAAGVNNTIVGYGSVTANSGHSNTIVIGANSTGKGANTGYINPNSGGVYQGNNSTAWSQTSDQRLKKNIVDSTIGLSEINQLKIRNFEYKTEDEITELKTTDAINKSGVQVGVIAQEIQTVLPNTVKQETTGVLSIDPNNLTWHMIKAIQELSAKNDALEARIKKLEDG